MTSYTIQAARYANAEQTAAVIETDEAGSVLISEPDTPDIWDELLASGIAISDYQPPFPSVVTRAQAKIALYNAGLLTATETAVAGHPYEVVRIWYAEASVWDRGNAYVQALGVDIGLTDEQMDDLFVAASHIA